MLKPRLWQYTVVNVLTTWLRCSSRRTDTMARLMYIPNVVRFQSPLFAGHIVWTTVQKRSTCALASCKRMWQYFRTAWEGYPSSGGSFYKTCRYHSRREHNVLLLYVS